MNAFLRAHGIQAVAGIAKHGLSHGLKRTLQEVVFVGPDRCDLHFALALQSLLGECGIQQHVRQQVKSDIEILAQHLGVYPETVVAAIAVKAATHRFDFRGDLFRSPGFCAFQQQFAHELGHPAIGFRFRQHAAL